VDSKNHKNSGAGGVGKEVELGCQEQEECSKRRRWIGVRGGPVEGERKEGREVTLSHKI